MADINKLVEQFAAGVKSSTREDIEKPLEGFEGWSASGKPEQDDTPTTTPLDAAHAVREAIAAKGGRRPKVDYWKPVAAKALGISRLFAKRWQAVLDAGIDAGLFRIDTEALAHPILVALEPEPEPAPEEVEHIAVTTPSVKDKDDFDYKAPWPPPGYVAPVTFRCGHTNHNGHGVTEGDPKQVAAREAGHCCTAMQVAVAKAESKGVQWKRPPSIHVQWRVRGLWDEVPVYLRRTPEKEEGMGWPGLCCDPETHLYIGGHGNNCRYNDSPERCVVHAPKPRRGDK